MMIDPFVLLTPVVLLVVVALLQFVGCDRVFGLHEVGDAPPQAPTGLTAKPGNARVTLSWNAYPGASDFRVKRALTEGGPIYDDLASVPGTQTSYRDEAVANGTRYYYVVTAMVSGKESAKSGEADAIPVPIRFVQLRERSEILNNKLVATPALLADVIAENLMVVWISYTSDTESVDTVKDSTAVNVYQRAVGPTRAAGLSEEIWYATIVAGGPALTVTATFTNAFNARKSIVAHEYAGADATEDPRDATMAASGTGSPASSGSATTSFADELIFGAAIFTGPFVGPFPAGGGTSGADFTARSTLRANVTEDRNVTSAGSYAATFTPADPALAWIAQMVTFK